MRFRVRTRELLVLEYVFEVEEAPEDWTDHIVAEGNEGDLIEIDNVEVLEVEKIDET